MTQISRVSFNATAATVAAEQAERDRRLPVVVQLFKASRKVRTSRTGVQFITVRGKVLDLDAERAEKAGLEKGQDIQLRWFAETPLGAEKPTEDPLADKMFFVSAHIAVDAIPFTYTEELVDPATGELVTVETKLTTARIRAGAFGTSVDASLDAMDALVADLKAERKAKRELVPAKVSA
jgi:hypothetical protein